MLELDLERRRQAACRRLGTNNPICVLCGETDPFTHELHHVAGRAYDDTLAVVCRNCHRKLTNPAANGKMPADPPVMECVGQVLIGLADFLALLVVRLRQYGGELLAGAKVCPRPYGWVDAPEAIS